MPVRAVWSTVTGMFNTRTLAQSFERDYRNLVSDLDDAISRMTRERQSLREEWQEMRERFRSYDNARGEVADLYYEKVDENRERFQRTHETLHELLVELRSRRSRANAILNELGNIHRRELAEEREYAHHEIRARLASI